MKKAYLLLYLLYVLIWGWLVEVAGRIIIFKMSSPAYALPPVLATWGKANHMVYNTSFQLIVMIGVLSISGFFISRRFHGASFYQVIGICFLITHLAGLLLLAIFVAVIQRNYYIVYSPERATAMAEIINYLFFTIIALSTAGMIAIKIMAAKKHGREVDNQK